MKRWEGDCSDEDRQNKTSSPYRELKQRIQRCKELTCVATKMKTRKDLMVSLSFCYHTALCMHAVTCCREKESV